MIYEEETTKIWLEIEQKYENKWLNKKTAKLWKNKQLNCKNEIPAPPQKKIDGLLRQVIEINAS